MSEVTFNDLRQANETRCEGAFHAINDWSPADWAVAMAGECGEACNLIKKLRRRTGPTMETGKANTPEVQELLPSIAAELADTVIYIDLLAIRLGIDLGDAVRDKFNKVSERVGSSIRL
jgi:NTP pyrophosphatase (non-canonical NTP hydrolase)